MATTYYYVKADSPSPAWPYATEDTAAHSFHDLCTETFDGSTDSDITVVGDIDDSAQLVSFPEEMGSITIHNSLAQDADLATCPTWLIHEDIGFASAGLSFSSTLPGKTLTLNGINVRANPIDEFQGEINYDTALSKIYVNLNTRQNAVTISRCTFVCAYFYVECAQGSYNTWNVYNNIWKIMPTGSNVGCIDLHNTTYADDYTTITVNFVNNTINKAMSLVSGASGLINSYIINNIAYNMQGYMVYVGKVYKQDGQAWMDDGDLLNNYCGNNCKYGGYQYSYYRCTTSSGSGDVSGDPLFNNLPDFDFTLKAASPCIGKGATEPADIIPTTDIVDFSREEGNDIGAYEYDSGVIPPDPVDPCTTRTCNDGTVIPATTALDIIKRSLRLLGVLATGETPGGPETEDALEVLNWMIDQWSNERLMIYYMASSIYDISAGKSDYSIGPCSTQDFNTSTPIRIDSAFCRDYSSGYNNDYKLEIIPEDRYQDIFQKGINTTYPRFLRYVRSWPYGTITLWPVPTRNYKLGFTQYKQFTKFVTPQDVVCLPPGYKQALGYNLAVELAPEYGHTPDPAIYAKARETKAVLMRVNNQPNLMSTDTSLQPRRVYNVYSDRY